MDGIDGALNRLEGAVDRLETALLRAVRTPPADLPALAEERDRLAVEVAQLRAASAREAELRHEAAAAVKAALADLRALMPEAKAHG